MIVGASYKIYECVATSKGSVHDSKVFENSDLFELLSTHNWRLFENSLIVGDSAYKVHLFFDDNQQVDCSLMIDLQFVYFNIKVHFLQIVT